MRKSSTVVPRRNFWFARTGTQQARLLEINDFIIEFIGTLNQIPCANAVTKKSTQRIANYSHLQPVQCRAFWHLNWFNTVPWFTQLLCQPRLKDPWNTTQSNTFWFRPVTQLNVVKRQRLCQHTTIPFHLILVNWFNVAKGLSHKGWYW